MKTEGHLDRCYLNGVEDDAANAIATAVGLDRHLILALLRMLLSLALPYLKIAKIVSAVKTNTYLPSA